MGKVVTFSILFLTLLVVVNLSQQIHYECDTQGCDPEFVVNGTVCNRLSGNCSCVCLKTVSQKSGSCWISDQCQYPGSRCISPSGQSLDIIDLNVWRVSKEDDRHPAPGICGCHSRFWDDESRKSCVRRVIGSRCRTSYQCAIRVPHSSCITRHCECSHDYFYDDGNDFCLKVLQVNHTDEVCLGEHCSLTHEANKIGLLFCLCATIFCFWCCSCCCCESDHGSKKTPEEVYLGKDSY